MKKSVILFFIVAISLGTVAHAAISRDRDPVVMSGASLGALLGEDVDLIVAFKYDDGWVQIPVQVDERMWVDFGTVYNDTTVNHGVVSYTDANTYVGADSDATFDVDDEIVVMAKDSGSQAPENETLPSGTVSDGAEVVITDPLTSNTAYIYLFISDGTLSQGAGQDYVTYTFDLTAGTYIPDYDLVEGPNPEDSEAVTSYYRTHFTDRWKCDELNIYAGDATEEDILDRHKNMFAPGNCIRTEDTFCNQEGAYFINKDGPIRGIRSYMGANSGPYTQRDHLFYEQRQDVATHLRVHSIPGVMDMYDYSPDASGMTYYNNLNTGGKTVDGTPDVVTAGTLTWEMVTGDQGTVISSEGVDTDITGLTITSYYSDDTTPTAEQCTGDDYEYSTSGIWVNSEIPNTDPTRGTYNLFAANRVVYYLAPDQTVATAEDHVDYATNPMTVTALIYPYPSLPTNGNFEYSTTGNPPYGWTTYIQSSKSGSFTIQTAIPVEGTRWQQTQVYNTGAYGGIRQNITGLTSGTVYTISGVYRTNSTSATSSVRYNLGGNTDRASSTILASKTDTNWGSFSGSVTASGTSFVLFLDHVNGAYSNKASAFDGVVVTGGLVITQQPAASSVCSGANAAFTVAADGTGTLTYQWQKSQTNLSNGGHYSGCTTATLSVTGADTNDVANYRCVVADDVGSVTSNEAALSLKSATSITGQPSAQSVCAGSNASFSVTGAGSGTLTYQWQKNSVNVNNGGHYSGCTTATLTVSTADTNDVANYRCVVTGDCGSATSNQAALSLNGAAVLTNGNFEYSTVGNPPYGWTTYIQSAKSGAWTIQTVSPPQGTRYQQTQVFNTGAFSGVRQNVTGLSSGAIYTITGSYRTNSTSATAAVRYNLSGNTNRAYSTVLVSKTATSWGTFSADVTASGTSLMLFLDHNNGTSSNKASAFDNIKVTCKP